MGDPVKAPETKKEWTKDELAKIEAWEKTAKTLSGGLIVSNLWGANTAERLLFETYDAKSAVPIAILDEKGKATGRTRIISGAEYRYHTALLATYANTEKMDKYIAAIDGVLANPKLDDEKRKKLTAGKEKILASKKTAYKEIFGQDSEPASDSKEFTAGIARLQESGKIFAGEVLARPATLVTPKETGGKSKVGGGRRSSLDVLPGKTLDAIENIKAMLASGNFVMGDEGLELPGLPRKTTAKAGKDEKTKTVAA